MSCTFKGFPGIPWLFKLFATLALALFFTFPLHPHSSFANDRSDLINPNRNFVLSQQESELIKSLAPLRVMIDDNFVPLSSYNGKTGSFEGLSVDIFRHVANTLSLKYQFVHDPKASWSEKVELFKKGKIDLLMPVSFTEERAAVGFFTSSYYNTYYGTIVNKSRNISIKFTHDLAPYKVGVTKASSIIPFMQTSVPAAKLMYFENQKDLYEAVRTGDIDIALQNKNVFQDDRFRLGFIDLIMPHTIVEYPRRYSYYFGKTESNRALAAIIDRYLIGADCNRLISSYERSEDELILGYNEQKHQKKLLSFVLLGSVILLGLVGIAYLSHRRSSATLAASLEQVRQQREQLQKSEAMNRSIVENIVDVIAVVDPDAVIRYVSPNIEKWFGWKSEESDGKKIWEGIHPDDREATQFFLTSLLDKANIVKIYECRFLCKDKSFRWIKINAVNLLHDPNIMGILLSFHDISDRRQAEELSSSRNDQLTTLIETIPDAIYLKDLHNNWLVANRVGLELWGLWDKPWHGKSEKDFMELVPAAAEALQACIASDEQAWQAGSPTFSEERIHSADGVWRDFETTRVPLFEYDGQRKCLVVVGRDVTKRKYAEAELRDSKNHYQAIVSSFDGQIYICSQDYKILFMNNSLIERTGHDAIGEPCFKTLHGLETVCPWCVNERVFKGETVRWEVQSPKDGRWYYVVNTPIYNEDGTISKQAMIQDITERKQTEDANRQLEQQFHHAQKLESLGVLAGGIAHDFNNILTVILGHCYVASEGPFSEQESKRHFEQIETAGNRAADLCRQMLTYAGKSQLVQTRVNLWLLIDEVVKMLQAAIKKNVTIELDLNRNVSDINGDTGQIQQVVMNLIINAAEAIGENNGTIKVTLSNLLVADGTTEMDTFGTVVHSGAYTCLEVSDTGCGMDEETQKRIFEPFYTTKFTGRGLGMSAIRGIVASHNSLLQLSSTPGVGTSFKVCFPVSETSYSEEVSPATPALASLEHWAGTVLLVEDEQTLRVIGTTVLEIFGLSVMTAQHGREALEIYSSHSAEIDLIMLDLLMPVMGGVEAYHELRRIDPTVPIIICSGYDTESISDVIKNDPFTGFVHKPYRPEGLQNEIMRMMAQSVKGTNGLR